MCGVCEGAALLSRTQILECRLVDARPWWFENSVVWVPSPDRPASLARMPLG